ncbi:plant-specific TFIIB-related protein 1 [Elaeis guineensis]|uniref:Plant-specific TFIIB-related protein 1 n=1 Tax=Elaeis guineensis var. tenera TaxID=51953 RepID=A0A6I9QG78_ELAGV|nr:plant-specific TFIIB-related protein 1 [Elaeis guineensis]
MRMVRCPYCPGMQGRCAATAAGRWVTECCSCGRVVEERHLHSHPLFLLRALDNPLPLVTPDLLFSSLSPTTTEREKEGEQQQQQNNKEGKEPQDDDDPFHPTGFITAFSTWSLEPAPVFARSASSFAGHLAELERALDCSSSSSSSSGDPSGGPLVSVDHLRAYLQILDVASLLKLDHDIADHAFQLFRDCSSATCLRNRSVEALATAALVQAIREAQEPRTLQEISTASNLPQKEIGKYIKILGEALKLSQPINSNSISVHMPRFCMLLQLNKSARELAAHIGEVVINKCFCTRRNPISISAAAIYLACQLEDKRKTQAEICKVTGLTEVTLRKVYKELLENWDDLLPPNYTPAVPPEKAFPMTAISSGRSTPKVDIIDLFHLSTHQDKDKHTEVKKPGKASDILEIDPPVIVKEEVEKKRDSHVQDLNQAVFWQPQAPFGMPISKVDGEKDQKGDQGMNISDTKSPLSGCEPKVNRDFELGNPTGWTGQTSVISSSKKYSNPWQCSAPVAARSAYAQFVKEQMGLHVPSGLRGIGNQSRADDADGRNDKDKSSRN